VYGCSIGKGLAFAYIKPHAAKADTALQVMVMGKVRNARVLAQAAYDPHSELPRK
jgi:dimethylglycine dehydrogenase